MAGRLYRMEAVAHHLVALDASSTPEVTGAKILEEELQDFTVVFKDAAGNRAVVHAQAQITGPDTVALEAAPPVASCSGSDFAGWRLVEIRCLWASSPDNVTLYNSDGIPAVPFRAVL